MGHTDQIQQGKGAKGFTLIEIMVSLILVVLLFTLSLGGNFDDRTRLEEASNHVERALRFCVDESILKNTIVRTRFIFNLDAHEIVVEFGPQGNFVLPADLLDEKIEDKEKTKKEKDINNKFNKIQEFQDSNIVFDDDIRITGVASSISQTLMTQGQASVYFYPSGEKDSALVMVASSDEIIAIKSNAFTMDIQKDYHPIEMSGTDSLQDAQEKLSRKIFEDWLKE